MKGKILSPSYNRKNGYKTVFLCGKDGSKKRFLVHRIVASAFLDNPNNYPCVNHKDENKTNNKSYNLEWCTKEYNDWYSGNGKNTCKKIEQLKDGVVVRVWNSARDASNELGVSYKNISAVCRGLRKNCGGYQWKFA